MEFQVFKWTSNYNGVSTDNIIVMNKKQSKYIISPILAPSAPLNFKIRANVSQQLSLSWEVPSITNGQILLYQYCYTKVDGGNQMCKNTTDNSTKSVDISNLG